MNQMRKYKIFIVLFLLTVTTAMFFSCSKEDALGLENAALELQSPYGRWKLEGYATTESKQIAMVFSKDPKAYYLTLNKDSTFTGTSSANEISGKFTIDTHRGIISFPKVDFPSSGKLNETNEGNLYLDRLSKVTKYRVFTNQLHFYYSDSDKEYLLFVKPVNP
ncbi:hypothetical protein SDC9_144748 [bioreactor metagenome]|uniref:Uncharacterized protein n=1 Tax=bioreactor metagenome TaxID=1076179 RepID=A0A645E9S9_9ZZZZ